MIVITSIADAGDHGKERIVMRASATTDVGKYAMLRTKHNGTSPTTGVTDTFWFPDKEVQANDLVVLYSKSGTSTERKNEDGTTTHFFYWARPEALWATPDFAAVLLHVDKWTSKRGGKVG